VTLFNHELVSTVKLCLVNVSQMRNLSKIFLRSFENVALGRLWMLLNKSFQWNDLALTLVTWSDRYQSTRRTRCQPAVAVRSSSPSSIDATPTPDSDSQPDSASNTPPSGGSSSRSPSLANTPAVRFLTRPDLFTLIHNNEVRSTLSCLPYKYKPNSCKFL